VGLLFPRAFDDLALLDRMQAGASRLVRIETLAAKAPGRFESALAILKEAGLFKG
jgi:hypothetical protein